MNLTTPSRIGVIGALLVVLVGPAVATHLVITPLDAERVALGSGELEHTNDTVASYELSFDSHGLDNETGQVDVTVMNHANEDRTYEIHAALKTGTETQTKGSKIVTITAESSETVTVEFENTVHQDNFNNVEITVREI